MTTYLLCVAGEGLALLTLCAVVFFLAKGRDNTKWLARPAYEVCQKCGAKRPIIPGADVDCCYGSGKRSPRP